jgi:iron complex outermembrane receptor protein
MFGYEICNLRHAASQSRRVFSEGPYMNQTHSIARKTRLLAGAASTAVLLGLTATPAFAQDQTVTNTSTNTTVAAPAESQPELTGQDAPATDIVVTGSRITRPDLQASSPVAVITGEALKLNNSVTVEQILTANPQFGAGDNASDNNPGTGAASIDLRRLGTNRTLVLLDGKRLPAYDTTGAVDVNTIPTALIKRIDILTGGASSVYGSDAVAGVVNFILNDRFTGLQVDGSSQVTERGDGQTYDASLTGGVKIGDRGNFIVSGNYSKRGGVLFGDRPYSDTSLDSGDLVSSGGSSNTTPTAFSIPGVKGLRQVTPTGALTSDVALYNFNPVNYGQIPLERYSGTALARYELSDSVELYGRAMYEHVNVTTTLAPTATAGFTFNIDPTNPFLSADERAAFFGPTAVINDGSGVGDDPTARAGTSQIGIRRRITETGGRVEIHNTESYQFQGGVRGDIGGFKYDVFGQYAEVNRKETFKNDLSYTALQQALDVVQGPNGPQCFDPSNGCVPLNLFGTAPISAASLAFVLRDATQQTKTTQLVTGANVSGDINFLKSPFADKPAAISVGVEYRRETAKTTVSDDFASGDLIYYGQGQNIGGSYDTKEVYGEIKMPIVQDRPFIHALNLEAGYRYSDYSTVGGVSTYKAGGDYSPFDGLRFRGIYQRAVRAPSVYELYSPVVAGTGSLASDPCATGVVTATVQAICRAQGAPAASFNADGTSNIQQPISGQINGFFGGNANLKAEKTDTFTVGAVFNPPRLRALAISIDYFNIDIANAIDTKSAQVTINQCYNIDQNATSAACSSIKRNTLDGSLSGGITVGLPETYANVSSIKTDGLDVSVGWHGGRSQGFNYSLGYSGTYTFNYTKTAYAGAPTIQCAGNFGTSCDLEPMPKYKHVVDATIGLGAISLQSRWRLIGAVHADADTIILKSHIPAYHYFDETIVARVNDKFSFRVGVQNLTNKVPPLVGDTVGTGVNAGSTFPGTYDFLGRSVFAGFTANF